MSVAQARREVATAEALFLSNLAQTHDCVQLLVEETRAAATVPRVVIGGALAGVAIYFLRPSPRLLLRLPLLLGAIDSLKQHFSVWVGNDLIWDQGPPT